MLKFIEIADNLIAIEGEGYDPNQIYFKNAILPTIIPRKKANSQTGFS